MTMESPNYEYTTGGDPYLLHRRCGGSGDVHEVNTDTPYTTVLLMASFTISAAKRSVFFLLDLTLKSLLLESYFLFPPSEKP
jgi:hypothetical protein